MTQDGSIVVVSDIFNNYGEPLIISIKINGKGMYELQTVDTNFITSFYGKRGIKGFIEKGINEDMLLYIENKKSHNLFSQARIQFPYGLNKYDFNVILRKSKYIVNEQMKNQ